MHCCDHDHQHASSQPVAQPELVGSAAAQAVLLIQKMDCPTEEKLIRDRFNKMAGIVGMEFNLMQRELTVHHNLPSVAEIVSALKKLDLDPVVKSDTQNIERTGLAEHGELSGDYRIAPLKWALMGVSGVAAIASEVVAWTSGNESSWLVIALALTAILTGGLDTLKKGWIALRHFSLNMNFLMSLAVIGAVLIGQWPEAAVVIFLFAAAEMIEALSLDRARNAIKGLMAMAPEMATVRNAQQEWLPVSAVQVQLDALVRVKPGERVPLDGIIVEGASTINQAPITGESMPVAKESGDTVFAGTINERGTFDYRVTALQSNSTLARIIKSVQQVQGDRAPTQRFVDQFARYYIPIVVLLAILVAVLPPLLLAQPFQPWLYKALVLLVIACPCALVISTPVTIVSGLAAAARHGILIKGGVYLELGRKLKALALDKTGTITVGKPTVSDVQQIHEGDINTMLRLAASLAQRSDHPVSSAVLAHWQGQLAEQPLFAVTDFEALTGRGVRGTINGEAYYLGNHRLIHELGICGPELEAALDAFEQSGKTAVVLGSAAAPLLILAAADTIRDSSIDAVARLKAMGVQVVMLTGDNPHTAEAIGAKVGISDVRGNQLPDDKLAAINELRTAYAARDGYVGMVGDGINDAPALARADIGFAMGAAGSDTALETADVALMDDKLGKLADFIALSKKTHAVLLQNIVLALGIKAVFLVLALGGEATLWMAVFADMGASLIVVFNGMRLLRAV
ncbi:putative cadmium-transporting ATPase [compost metagenome]